VLFWNSVPRRPPKETHLTREETSSGRTSTLVSRRPRKLLKLSFFSCPADVFVRLSAHTKLRRIHITQLIGAIYNNYLVVIKKKKHMLSILYRNIKAAC
jgi:hypothetical protein